MVFDSADEDELNYYSGTPTPVVWGEAYTGQLSYSEYFRKVRQALDENGLSHVQIMFGEWGVAPRGHWRLNTEAYQTTLMFAEIFMQAIESGVIDYMGVWPFCSEPGWAVTYRTPIINNPEDGKNELQGTYSMQQMFASFVGGRFVEVETGSPDLVAIGSYKESEGELYIAVINKSDQLRRIEFNISNFSCSQKYVQKLVPLEDPELLDNTYSSLIPSLEKAPRTSYCGSTPRIVLKPFAMAWIRFD